MATDRVLCALLAASLAGCAPFVLHAPDSNAELRAALSAARRVAIGGPAEVRLADRTVLQLDAGFAFIPPAEGGRLLRASGRRTREYLLGVVVVSAPDAADIAALYSMDRDPALPELRLDGWTSAPALAGFRQKK